MPLRAAKATPGRRLWPWLTLAFGVLVVIVVPLSRYPEWDEAVFLSQSGGLPGVDAEPAFLVASRERGTPALIGVLRLLAPTLANTRLLWMAVTLAVLIGAMIQIGRVLQFPAIVPAALVAGYWLTYSFASSFFSFYLAGCFMLLASGLYFRLRASEDRQLVTGLALGLTLAAVPWLRQVEGALFILLLVGHSVVVTPRPFWRTRWPAITAAAGGFVAAFVVPWVVDSVARFGSVGERIASGRGQSFERGLSNQFGDYIATLRGVSQTYDRLAMPPAWATVVITLLLVVLLGLALAGAMYRRRLGHGDGTRGPRLGARAFLWVVGAAMTAFFMFFIGEVSDRYMVIGSMFLLVAATATAWPIVSRGLQLAHGEPRRRRAWVIAVAVGLSATWFVANAVVADTYETARFLAGTTMERNVAVIRALAGEVPCHGASRYGAPQIEFGTGCDVRAAEGAVDVRRVLGNADRSEFTFALWPAENAEDVKDAVGGDPETLLLPSRGVQRDLLLVYNVPNDVD